MLTSRLTRTVAAAVVVCSVASLGSLTAHAASSKAPKADPNATLTIGGAAQVATTYDPLNDAAISSNLAHDALVYDRLFRYTVDGTDVVPMLATGYKFDSTGTQLTLTLRKGVKYDDGTPFNASVVVANLQRAKTGTTSQAQMANITDVSAVDDSTVMIKQAAADPTTPLLLAYAPGFMLNPAAFSDLAKLKTNPGTAGSGPYKFVSVDASLTYTYDKKSNYWDGDNTRPAHIVVKNIVDENTRLNALKTGQVDYTYNTPITYESLKTDTSIKITSYPAYSPFSILVNDTKAPFNNPDVRKAISLGLDRKAVNAGLNGLCTPTDQFVPKGVPGNDSSLKIQEDLKQAKELIQKAGASGMNLSMTELNVEPHKTITSILQNQLGQMGLNVTLDLVPGGNARPVYRAGTDPMLAVTALPLFADPSNYLDAYMFGIENPGTKNYPQLKSMLDAARVKPLGSKARATAFEEIAKSLQSGPIAYIPVCTVLYQYDANTRVLNMDKLEFAHLNQAVVYSDLRIAKTK